MPKKGTVVLEPDIQAYFPNSESVNQALHCLIPLLPRKKDLLKVRAGQGIVNFFIYSRIDDIEILDVSSYKPRRIPSPTWR